MKEGHVDGIFVNVGDGIRVVDDEDNSQLSDRKHRDSASPRTW